MSDKMQLLDLPPELLELLPHHLSSLQDLYSLLRTCRFFSHVCESSKAVLSPAFPKLHGQPLFPPHPHLLLAGVTRQVADWAVQSDENRAELYESLLQGNEGLLNLAIRLTQLNLADVRALYAVKGDLLYPLTEIVECEVGHGHYRLEGIIQGMDPSCRDDTTFCENPELALLNYWIYCELFHHNIDLSLSHGISESTIRPLSYSIRQRWWAYCVPDRNNKNRPDHADIQELQLLDQTEMWRCFSFDKRVRKLVFYWQNNNFSGIVPRPRNGINVEYLDHTSGAKEKKLSLFLRSSMHLGRDSLEMLLPGGLEKFEGRLEDIKQRVSDMDAGGMPTPYDAALYDDESTLWWKMSLDAYECFT